MPTEVYAEYLSGHDIKICTDTKNSEVVEIMRDVMDYYSVGKSIHHPSKVLPSDMWTYSKGLSELNG